MITVEDRSKWPTPFKRVASESGIGVDTGIRFEAEFLLPNDGVSENKLVVRVDMDHEEASTAVLTLLSRGYKDREILCSHVEVMSLASLLYKFATLRTKHYLEYRS